MITVIIQNLICLDKAKAIKKQIKLSHNPYNCPLIWTFFLVAMLFSPANLVYWIFLAMGIILFLSVIISGTDEDLDTDGEAPLALEGDMEADVEGETEGEIGEIGGIFSPLIPLLSWLGVGNCPLILLLAINFSSWGVIGWFLNFMVAGFLGKFPTGFLAFVIFFVSLLCSLWIGSILSRPIGKIFSSFSEEVEGERLIGCTGQVTSKSVPYITEGRIAQADVMDAAKNLVTIPICLPQWAKVVPVRGQEIIIIEKREHCYLAIAKDSSDQDRWLTSQSDYT
ncbi:MAG: DUF1449 family protein [Geminocystis sp.]|nr:YqiJ family protein [Geminocystis sp.]MDW8116750.1 DUF1449 family protein [Geminocystis sp.]MDW8463479.1 DUF1449 family protein [Geminocystis sp.]